MFARPQKLSLLQLQSSNDLSWTMMIYIRNYSLKLCYTIPAFYLFLSALFAHHSACMPTAPPTTEKITITVPKGTRLQGHDPQILCTPSKWTDVAVFLLANYVAHAVTLKSLPGESTLSVLRNVVCSLLFPISGVRRGVTAIYQRAILAKTPLEAAAKAGALCMVTRTLEWKPEHGDVVRISGIEEPQKKPWWVKDFSSSNRAKRVVVGVYRGIAKVNRFLYQFSFLVMTWKTLEDEDVSKVPAYIVRQETVRPFRAIMGRPLPDWEFLPSSSNWDSRSRTIHGVCQLPSGYALCAVPPGSHVVELDKDQQGGEDQSDQNLAGGEDTRDEKNRTDGNHGEGKVMVMSLYSRFKTQVSSKWGSRRSSLDYSHPSTTTTTQLSSVNNLAKGLIAIFQTLYASFTLYHARGDQIQHYGYAAFGLTVVPYIVMSIINLASTVLTPDYSVMYLVESEAMDEARKRENAKFDGVVGRILTTSTPDGVSQDVKFEFDSDGKMAVLARGSDAQFTKFDEEAEMDKGIARIDPWTGNASVRPFRRPLRIISRSSELPRREPAFGHDLIISASYALALISLAVNGALSHFKSHQSTRAQRAWTMAWLALGIVANRTSDVHMLQILAWSPPAIGGFVVVCQMILQYGNCVKLS